MTKSALCIALLVLVIISAAGCKKNTGINKIESSSYNSTASRKMSGACQNCHISGGSGPGWWNAAGTVYKSDSTGIFANATILFYDSVYGKGNLVAKLEGDQYGNFYTSNTIKIIGKYPEVASAADTQYMLQPVTSGNCNACHGVSTAPMWVR